MIRVHLSGPHADRSPLSYTALAALFAPHIRLLPKPESADLLVFSHSLDIEAMPAPVYDHWSATECPIVLLSEEPFWDTIWAKKPLQKSRNLTTKFGAVPVIQLNHHTSDIFDFDQIPYYLLTNLRFASAYAYRFRRNATKRAADWQVDFAAYPADTSFMAVRRDEKYHNVRHKRGDIIGLCAWRSELALACKTGVIERLGQSWDRSWNQGRDRFDLRDWHLDKLTNQDRRSRLFSAVENTHQPGYLSEKLFDAFALGSRPFYFASPGHRIHDLGLPPAAWINLYDLPVAEAAQRLEATPFDTAFFTAYAEAQHRLERLFTNPDIFIAERTRLQTAVVRALTKLV